MRHGYLFIVVAGCGFKASAGPAPVPDGGVPGMVMFDSAAELGAAGYVGQNMTIEARGSLTPDAYTYGGLVAHGYQDLKLWTHTAPSWAQLADKVPTGAGLWRGERLTNAANFFNNLNYLGISDPGKMTLTLEGEVWLDAGSNEKLELTGDDVAFFQIALPGTSSFGAVSDSNNTEVPVDTPVSGWYPIRIGHTNGAGGNNLEFTHSDLGAPKAAWTRDRLRARTSALTGALRVVCGRQILGGGQNVTNEVVLPISTFEAGNLLTTTGFATTPQGAGADDWSARYAGQVYVTQPGSYTLTINSDDGARARLGTTGHGESHWQRDVNLGLTQATATADLRAGWNDLSVDYNHVTGSKSLHVQLSGPDFANVEVPADPLRPVESSDDRVAFGSDDTDHLAQDNGGPGMPGTEAMTVAGAAGETVASIDVTFEVNSPHWGELKVDLEAPSGVRVLIRDRTSGPDGDQFASVTVPLGTSPTAGTPGALLNASVKGVWKLHVYDVVDSGNTGDSTVKGARITLHTQGGPEKIARTASWTSPVVDQSTGVFAIDSVMWDERVPDGATLQVSLRTCQQADCSDGMFTTPVTRGVAFAVPAGRYLQLRVDMTSSGVLEPELRSLAVVFRRAP